MTNILTIISAIFGLSFLIFIHELGHYWMARRVGMRVETFSIGFGRPIKTWIKDGVKWQICWILMGGYVKIAGTETDEKIDPYLIKDGFFGKSPLDRIKVAIMGPFVNLLFAFLVFAILWALGGREKDFADYTHKIGWIDPSSALFVDGVRPGDEITAYDDSPFQGASDHLTAPITSQAEIKVSGNKVDYSTLQKTPFDYTVATYPHPKAVDKTLLTAGVLEPARYLIYNKFPSGKENPLPEGSPMKRSGLEYGDRIIWVNGHVVFSLTELKDLINDPRVLLTIQRGDKVLLARVPRVQAQELKPNEEFRQELIDWQFEAGLNDRKFQYLWTIPYNLTYDCVVENRLRFIDSEADEQSFPKAPFSLLEEPLQAGDKILAVQGTPIKYAYQLLNEIQVNRANIIVERQESSNAAVSQDEADGLFDKSVQWNDLNRLANSIGTAKQLSSVGTLYLLKPVVPKSRQDLITSEETKSLLAAELVEKRKAAESLEDPEKKQRMLSLLDDQSKELVIGVPFLQDKKVIHNPGPAEQFAQVFSSIGKTLRALFTGAMNVKFLAGPVGIIDMVQQSTTTSGLLEALFWLGAISLNLGVLNLLPIPVLDGGTIVICLIELLTGKKIKPKTLERLIMPFMFLFLILALLLTYQDVLRIFNRFFH